jgi:hypothetical protein
LQGPSTKTGSGREFFNRDPVCKNKSRSDCCGKIADRFAKQNRSAIDPDPVFNRGRDRDENFKIASRLRNENRDPILKCKSQIDCETLS